MSDCDNMPQDFQLPITGTYQRIQTSLVWEKGEEADLDSE